MRSLVALGAIVALLAAAVPAAHAAEAADTIARVKRSVVAVGTFQRTRSPSFQFRGTGFAVGDGSTIVNNSHVLPESLKADANEELAVLSPGEDPDTAQMRAVHRLAVDPGTDLALLKLDGTPLPPLQIGDSAKVREGQPILMTGFPLGAVLGPFAATHRGMVAAITPIAIPQARASALNPAIVHRLTTGSFPVFQLDATAYPGNSGSPIYDPDTGEVLGIVNMVFVKGTKETAITRPSGITYAIPASHLTALVKSAK
jgi:S1-C subfamily serine protease